MIAPADVFLTNAISVRPHTHQPRRQPAAVLDDRFGFRVGHLAVQAAPLDIAVHRFYRQAWPATHWTRG